jgi:putative chitinase
LERSPEGDTRALIQAAELVRETTPLIEEARLNETGVAEIGYRLTMRGWAGVILGDRMTQAQADASLWHELLSCDELARGALSDWDLLGPSRRAAVLAFLLGPGCGDERGTQHERAHRRRQLRSIWRYPDAVERLLLQFGRDNLGRLSPELANRRQREATLWNSETVMTQTLKANQDTFLKKAPIASSYLSPTGKVKVAANSLIRCATIEDLAGDAHDLVTLEDQAGQWYIFGPHFAPDPVPAPAKGRITAVDWTDLDAPVGRYFTVREVLRGDLRRRPAAGSPEEKSVLAVIRDADAIREAWGGPILITSGYRPEPYNRAAGGVPNSRHVVGDALDIFPGDGDLSGFFQWLKPRWSGGLGDGRRKGFLHIDKRDGGGFHPKAGVSPSVIWDY